VNLGDFFKGWRRKVGVMTLVMACVFTGGWVRSLSIVDAVSIPIAKHILINVSSDDQSVICEKQGIEFRELTWEFLEWNGGQPIVTNHDGGYQIHWLWKWHGFGVADGIAYADIPPSFSPATIWLFPYWSFIIPLSLISFWLLLSKPRKSTPMKTIEPTFSDWKSRSIMREVIEHRKTTASEERSLIFSIVITLVGMGVFLWFLSPPTLFLVAFITIVGVVASIAIYNAVVNLQCKRTFVCRIDDEQISCVSPVSNCGESFSIPIRTIARIERMDGGESPYRWYIWNQAGERFWLTSNYDNPVDSFVDAIRERCPDVTEFHSPCEA
jgi:hypothetical protein